MEISLPEFPDGLRAVVPPPDGAHRKPDRNRPFGLVSKWLTSSAGWGSDSRVVACQGHVASVTKPALRARRFLVFGEAMRKLILVSVLGLLLSACSIKQTAVNMIGDALSGGGGVYASDEARWRNRISQSP